MNYIYSRDIIPATGQYDIENPNDVDGNGHSVLLETRIIDALPDGGLLGISLNSTTATISMNELSVGDKIILDNTVAVHKAANGIINQETYLYLTSYNGTVYQLSVNNSGTLIITAA